MGLRKEAGPHTCRPLTHHEESHAEPFLRGSGGDGPMRRPAAARELWTPSGGWFSWTLSSFSPTPTPQGAPTLPGPSEVKTSAGLRPDVCGFRIYQAPQSH